MSSDDASDRIEDVESDILLPFLDHKTVLLNLGPLETQTYNVLQAVIAINAVDSERVDQVLGSPIVTPNSC